MATRKAISAKPVEVEKGSMAADYTRWKKVGVVLVVGALVVGFWAKTKSWPVVALVNGVPVSRFEVDQMMYNRIGQQAVDEIITKRLIERELAEKKVKVDEAEVTKKLDDIKKQIGSDQDFAQALAFQGLTEAQLKEQIKFQLGLEKLVEPSTDSAKLQQDIMNMIQKLRTDAKIWVMK